jgi:hypothetical protein
MNQGTSDELMLWVKARFNQFGSIYRASSYGRDASVVMDPFAAGPRKCMRDSFERIEMQMH